MPSVKSIVKSETDRRNKINENIERELKARDDRLRYDKFDKEVNAFIFDFEHRYFKLESSNRTVADAIIAFQEDSRSYVTGDRYEVLSFDDKDDGYKIPIEKSVIFFKWKLKLERKFDITINFYEHETASRRFGNSGYEMYPDYKYEGICVKFFID